MTTSSSIYEVTPCVVCVDPETLVITLENHEQRMERSRARTEEMEAHDERLKRLKDSADRQGETVLSEVAEGLEAKQRARVGHRRDILDRMEELVVATCARADVISCIISDENPICPKLALIRSIQPTLRAIATEVPTQEATGHETIV